MSVPRGIRPDWERLSSANRHGLGSFLINEERGARLPMRKIGDMLRLTGAGMSSRKIAASLSIGGTTVVDCLQRARAVGVGWPLPADLSDVALDARLFPALDGVACFDTPA
jgi:hypothetical protein